MPNSASDDRLVLEVAQGPLPPEALDAIARLLIEAEIGAQEKENAGTSPAL